MELILRILLFLSAAATFGYGAAHYFGKKGALFKVLVSLAFGCLMLGRLYDLVTLLIRGSIPTVFNIGMLAIIGGFMFIFSASYGQMDGLVDDKSPSISRYRLLSLLAPAVILSFAVPVFRMSAALASKLVTLAVLIVIALAACYNLKHLLIPDVSFGIIDSIREYSGLALDLGILYGIQFVSERIGNDLIWIVSSVCIAVITPFVLLAMERGSRKWTI